MPSLDSPHAPFITLYVLADQPHLPPSDLLSASIQLHRGEIVDPASMRTLPRTLGEPGQHYTAIFPNSCSTKPIGGCSPYVSQITERYHGNRRKCCRKHSWKVDSNEFTSVYVKSTFSVRLGYLPTGNIVDRWMTTKPERMA